MNNFGHAYMTDDPIHGKKYLFGKGGAIVSEDVLEFNVFRDASGMVKVMKNFGPPIDLTYSRLLPFDENSNNAELFISAYV